MGQAPAGDLVMRELGERAAVALAAAVLVVGTASVARAGCNLIPGTAKTFNSTMGATNRPYAAPGERLELAVRSCDTLATGLTPNPADHIVTVVFTPASGPRHAIVLNAADCSAIASQLSTCADALTGGGTATCIPAASAGVQIVDRNGVRFLGFKFPDTDTFVGTASDDRTLTGPARIAVTSPGDDLPCYLATSPCGSQPARACIDAFFANDGNCGTAVPQPSFGEFIALPPPNDYASDCFSEGPPPDGPCTATAPELRFTADSLGNLLLPVGWSGILVPGSVPVPRLLRARLQSPLPFEIPDRVFVSSFTPEGGILPPIFEPQVDPTLGDPDVVTLFGSVDAPYTILASRASTARATAATTAASAARRWRTARTASARRAASAIRAPSASSTPTAAPTGRARISSTPRAW